jgi:hypothetical protein
MTGYVVKKAKAPKVLKSKDGNFEVHVVRKAKDGKPVVVGAKARTAKGAKSADLMSLVESLSAGQKEIMKERGYLKISDLTVKQQSLLGEMAKGDGKFEIAFSDGKTKVRIKS